MPSIPASCDVVVLGAGPAGLAAAWYATERGHSVAVIDHASRVGGLAGSMTVAGQSVDFGSHRLHPSIEADVLSDLRRLGVELQWRPRRGRIRMQERWLDFPLRARDLLRHAPFRFTAGVVGETFSAPIRRRITQRRFGGPKSFADAARRGLGPTIADAFYAPYARKLWATEPDELSVELYRRRVSTGSAAAIMRKLLRRGPAAGFWYPANGFGAIGTALADGIRAAAGVVATDTSVRAVAPVAEQVGVTLSDGRSVTATTLISTIPADALLGLLAAPREVRDAAAQLQFRGAVLLYLTLPIARYTMFDAHYFPESTTIVSRLSEPKNYRSSALDPVDQTVLCAEIPASPGDDIWRRDVDALAHQVIGELESLGLPGFSGASAHVERRTHVYPVYRVGHEVHQRIVDEYLDSVANLTVVGRQATFAHDNTHHALLMGRSTANALRADGHIDTTRWREARRAFADHVVED